MKLDLRKIYQNHQWINYVIFWAVALIFLTISNNLKMDFLGYRAALYISLCMLPLHILFFFITIRYIVPNYLEQHKYGKMIIFTLLFATTLTFLYRLTEVLIVDPYLVRIAVKQGNQTFIPFTIQQIAKQMLNPNLLMNAFEKINSIVWFAVAIKFFKMWYERKQLALQAELNFLKAQIHPHFLFNTLNNLYALTLKKSTKSSSIVLGLSEILRYMLYECKTENVKLTRDLEILKNYIALEEIRYGDRLDLQLNIQGNLENKYIPPLLMLPFVENAFKYGASETLHNSWIKIDINILSPNHLKFKVMNSKPNYKDENPEVHFKKIGLKNVRKRLDFLYKDSYQLDIYNEDEVFAAILEIDLNQKCTRTNKNEQNKYKELLKSGWAAL